MREAMVKHLDNTAFSHLIATWLAPVCSVLCAENVPFNLVIRIQSILNYEIYVSIDHPLYCTQAD
jgi:hypothetical protein